MKRGPNYLHGRSKRALDLLGGVALIGMAAPLTVVAASALAYERRSLRKPFFTQQRIGYMGQTFPMRKLRTLPMNSADHSVYYGSHDPRAKRIARFIRIIGADEGPQLLSVIKGDMSLVGPRPRLLDQPPEEHWRMQMKPGLFGVSQTERRRHPGMDQTEDCIVHDADYFNNATLVRDVGLIVTTPFRLCAAALDAYRQQQPAGAEA